MFLLSKPVAGKAKKEKQKMNEQDIFSSDLAAKRCKALTDKERTVVLGRKSGRTFREIGEELGHSKQAAAYITKKRKLTHYLSNLSRI